MGQPCPRTTGAYFSRQIPHGMTKSRRETCSNSMSFGLLCRRKPTNPGSGLAYAVGGRGADVCAQLKKSIPQAYCCTQTASDFWEAYKNVFGCDHRGVSKVSGETAHVERWNNTLRQRLRRFVRKTLSFSKNQETSLKIFIHEYNITARHKYLVE